MSVDVAHAEADGLLLEHEGRTYAFCNRSCRGVFLAEPATHPAKAGMAAAAPGTTMAVQPLVIDEGLRRWYESCSCCLSDAYPEVKAQLDAERIAHAHEPAGPGICEVAEAG
jgi:YHS domain-containing protein